LKYVLVVEILDQLLTARLRRVFDESFSHMLKYAFNHFNLSGLEKVEVDGTG
jgi:hypothetical protein